MPSKSDKQARFMEIASHSAIFAKKAGISQKVARDFHAADKAKRGSGRVRRLNERIKK